MKISIITAVYNRASTIREAVESVEQQTHDDLEHIVIDGASTDGTLQELAASQHPRMVLFSERDSGIYDALNRGISRCSGDVIGLLHSDDVFASADVLRSVATCFEKSGADAVYGDLDYVSAEDPTRVIRHWVSGEFVRSQLGWGWMPPHPALFLRRAVYQSGGLYDTSFRIASDYDAILRYFSKPNFHAAYLPEVLVKMRMGGASNGTIARILIKSREDYRAIRKNRIGGAWTLAMKNLRKLHQFIGN